jgi:hypothetical protein
MRDPKMLYPIKEGKYQTFTLKQFQALEFYKYGIYKCKIYRSEDININKLFRFNKMCTYTHIDLNLAKKIGLIIKIKENSQYNALIYERSDLIQGHHLFGNFVDYLFKMKQDGIEGSKAVLNCLWCTNKIKYWTYNFFK